MGQASDSHRWDPEAREVLLLYDGLRVAAADGLWQMVDMVDLPALTVPLTAGTEAKIVRSRWAMPKRHWESGPTRWQLFKAAGGYPRYDREVGKPAVGREAPCKVGVWVSYFIGFRPS